MKKFGCVRITCTTIGLCGRGGFVPRPKPAQNATAARLAFQSFSVTLPMCTGCWARTPVRCEKVVSLSYDKWEPTVSISGALKLHFKKKKIKKMCSSVLPFFLVEGSIWFNILLK